MQSTYSHAPLASSSGARLRHRVEKRLRTLHAAGLARTITDLDMIGPVTARSRSSQIYTVFSSNNYLGLNHHPKVLQAAADALIKGGTSSTGSRLISGGIARGSDLEKKLARFKGCEAALLFNTGYLANLGALYTLLKKGDLVFSDELNHASIIDGCRISGAEVIVYRHNDMTDLEQKLAAYASNQTAVKLIVTDGVFSMDGDLCRLPELAALKNRYGTLLIPIIVGSVERAAAIDAFLKERGILLSAIRPPSVPMGTARLRLTLSAAHTKPQLQQVLSLLKEAWQQIP